MKKNLPPTVIRLVKDLDLTPHPEGGFFRETYRAATLIPRTALPKTFHGSRASSTAILFLLVKGQPSRLHRIASDEVWHFHAGGTLAVHVLHSHGHVETLRLGKAHAYQAVVPAGAWFGASVEKGRYALVGCTVAPGFDFADFELAKRDALLKQFPRQKKLILKLT